jgi:Zn-dependent protease/CBS domain-containing protein
LPGQRKPGNHTYIQLNRGRRKGSSPTYAGERVQTMPDESPNTGRRTREPDATQHAVRLVRVAGIPIRLHYTFFLLLIYFALMGRNGPQWQGIVFMVAVFTCVVLHELGHSLVAQHYGIKVAEIVLYPIGGVARMEKLPKPHQELWIALAGPAVNVVIALILFGTLKITGNLIAWDKVSPLGGSWVQMVVGANIFLALFNMIPAFPMDGGRVLRAILGMRMDEYRATQIAASIGQILAFVLGFIALMDVNIILMFIAFFVFIGAGQEAMMYQGKALVEGLPVREAMITEFRVLPVGTSLGEARELLLRTSQTDFPISHGDEIVGVLSRNALLHGLADNGPTAYVAGSMEREFATTSPDAGLEEIASEMQTGRTGCVLVMEAGKLVGIVTKENLAELLIVRQIMRQAPNTAR